MSTTEIDYLIVGQGLAGSILAHNLITQGKRVIVIDRSHKGSSSNVAAGIINPITGPRLKKNDNFNTYFAHAKRYYAKLEYHIKETVFNEIGHIRQIQTADQQDFLEKRLSNTHYHEVIARIDARPSPFLKKSLFSQVSINGTAVINTRELLSASKRWLSGLHCFKEDVFDYQELIITSNGINYRDIFAKKVIFCEGYQAINNPWLKHLPFKLAKGEVLTLKNQTQNVSMLSWGKWLVPHGKTAKLGSNFEWNDLSLDTNEKVKSDLLESLNSNTNIEPHVLLHEAGIRPSTRQRDPFVGAISTLDNAYCFNGFGSKGCLLIPFYATLLSDHLQDQTPLPKKVTQWL